MGFLRTLFGNSRGNNKTAVQTTIPTSHQEDWIAYLSTIDNDKVGSIVVDLGLENIAPIPNKLNRVRIDIKMQHPNPNGLPLPQEFDILNEIEEKVSGGLKSNAGAIPAGHLYCEGTMSLYEYIGDGVKVDTSVSEAMSGFPTYRYDFRIDREDTWKSYTDLLYPLPIQMQSIFNQRVVEGLKSHGDKLEVRRLVHHLIYFKNEADIEHFLSEIQGNGFEVRQKERVDVGEYKFSLLIEREDRVDLKSVDEYVLYLWQKARDANGDYDGWGGITRQRINA
jgi:uncharacterized protein (TIGR01619 family)